MAGRLRGGPRDLLIVQRKDGTDLIQRLDPPTGTVRPKWCS
jgi:hypothetical protein